MAQLNLDLSGYEPQGDFDPIPPGDYIIEVVDSDVSTSRAGNPMAKFTFEVVGPSHAGRKIWDHFVLNNEVALRRLKALAEAAGHKNPNYVRDTEELHGLRCEVRVAIEEQEGYPPKNKISSYRRPRQTSTPAVPPPSQGRNVERKSVPPWEAAQ
jgi:hypothetical protein